MFLIVLLPCWCQDLLNTPVTPKTQDGSCSKNLKLLWQLRVVLGVVVVVVAAAPVVAVVVLVGFDEPFLAWGPGWVA